MQNERGSLRGVVLLLLIVLGGWWVLSRWVPPWLKGFGANVETTVNRELVAAGISDRKVHTNLHQEHHRLGVTWVENVRTIEVTDAGQVQEIVNRLGTVADRKHLGFRRQDRDGETTLTLGRWFLNFQRLTLTGKPAPTAGTPPPVPRAAIVIDDVAYDVATMDRYAALGVPLTFAILPRDKRSKALADKAVSLQFSVIIHMPMEPKDRAHNDPGPAGLYLDMTEAALRKQFDRNMNSIPHLVGLNNHMGSAFTEDEAKMRLVMHWLKERGLFFLDSHTSIKSVACRVAKQTGVPCLINDTFLDNSDEVEAIEKQLDEVIKLALRDKQTIAIGHYRRKHLVEALKNKLPDFKAKGVQLVTLPTFYPSSFQ